MDEKKIKEKEEEKKRFHDSHDTRERNIVVKETSDYTNQKKQSRDFFHDSENHIHGSGVGVGSGVGSGVTSPILSTCSI